MRRFILLPVLALGLVAMLGGCVLYPDGYGYEREGGYSYYGGHYGGGWGHYRHGRDRW